ncbi:hypothetical protein CCMSSC00406_0009531 [Pleurotus cornucopiae]|uniref:Uncharacterized protein n=1 Tax=Pleurotus cornucopiae TaxID=5321 RepID=A0ACB7IQX2_PLECO|nr:hypothetical protein CCMSSC00406_0009531 [Pleurotus cornucopiae]
MKPAQISLRRLFQTQECRSYSTSSSLHLRSNIHNSGDLEPARRPEHDDAISDAEWELRTGRAIDVLTSTLPHFFSYGLVSSIDRVSGTPRTVGAIASANPLDFRNKDDVETIYSPKIRLSYTPPIALPAPFPKTLHVEGLPLYLSSAVFIRHTLNALYSDTQVILRKVVVQTPGSRKFLVGGEIENSTTLDSNRRNREKSLFIGLTVNGVARVSGGLGEWNVNSTYTFSPLSGLIHVHTIDSIQPAPHQTVYDALRSSLGKVFGLGLIDGGEPQAGGAGVRAQGPVACEAGSVEKSESGTPPSPEPKIPVV